jgi:hypothetical protein
MKYFPVFLAMIITVLFDSCTYNIPPDNNIKVVEGNMGTVQNPKNMRSLKKILTANDINRAHEYELLRNQLDSTTILMQTRVSALQDSVIKLNINIEGQGRLIKKQMSDMQTLLYIMLIIIVILLVYVLYRFPLKKAKIDATGVMERV